MDDTSRDELTTEEAPGLLRLVFLVAGGAVALGIGWVAFYLVYRYLGSAW